MQDTVDAASVLLTLLSHKILADDEYNFPLNHIFSTIILLYLSCNCLHIPPKTFSTSN